MNNDRKQSGLTLTELLVVVAIMAIMFSISVPAAKALFASLDQSAGTRSIINAALSNARAIAIREGAYAGVRFQMDSTGKQHLVFVINDKIATGLANGFRSVDGRKPMPLSEHVHAISLKYTTDADLKDAVKFTEAVSFSVVFNASGNMVIHPVRFNGTMFQGTQKITFDDGKNSDSVNSFLIYDTREWDKNKVAPWTGYLLGVSKSPEYVNPYTGQLVDKNPQ